MLQSIQKSAAMNLDRDGAVLFSTEINVATLVQKKQGKACEHNKTNYDFPHFKSPKKKTPAI
ncbi:MAG: hypothetical protein H7228_14785 [Polaromonas sp.]|nr:hypothetical protein [Polaromonas sp.]